MTIDELAQRLDQFAYDYDFYGYMYSVEDRQSGFEQIKEDLLNGDTEGIRSFLQEAIDELEPDDEMLDEASSLLKELEACKRSDCRTSVLTSIREAGGINSGSRRENRKPAVETER